MNNKIKGVTINIKIGKASLHCVPDLFFFVENAIYS